MTYGIFRRKEVLTKSAAELDAYYAAIPDETRRAARRAVVEQGIAAPVARASILALNRTLADVETALADNNWLAGQAYGLADALTPFVSRLDELSLGWCGRTGAHNVWWIVSGSVHLLTRFSAIPTQRARLAAAGR